MPTAEFILDASLDLLRAEGEKLPGFEDDKLPKFRATLARRDVVDSDGLLVQPMAFEAQAAAGEAVPLIRYHGKDPSSGWTTLGAGHVKVNRDEAWVEGELHNTAAAREFVGELEGLQRYGLGESSVGGRATDNSVRKPQGLERNLGAKAVVGTARAHEVSFCTTGKMPGSNLDLIRAMLPSIDGGDEMPTPEQTPNEGTSLERELVKLVPDILRSLQAQTESQHETIQTLIKRHDVADDVSSEADESAAEDSAEAANDEADSEAAEEPSAPAAPPATDEAIAPAEGEEMTSEQKETLARVEGYLSASRQPLQRAATSAAQNGS